MMDTNLNPRSILHAIEPIGLETSDVESLTSYFCRLAFSHSMTARNLSVWILEHHNQPVPECYKWFRRSFSGMSPEGEQWAAWLAELTARAGLDRLTLAPWRHLLAGAGLAPQADRWCPCCLQENLAAGNSPYLRLSWEIGAVTACPRHKVALESTCPHCHRTDIRNRASAVIPGYCTSCGGFLGAGETVPATSEELWVARQVGNMLANSPQVSAEGVTPLLEAVIERMSGGNVAAFAKKLGLSKSGVWYWVNEGGQPRLQAWLSIALHGGIGLDKLFAGDIEDWVLPVQPLQLQIPILCSPRKGIKGRRIDWDEIRPTLRAILEEAVPITLAEACDRVGVEYKQLYQRANQEARAIADRYQRHQALNRYTREERLREQVSELLQERLEEGYQGMSARDVLPRVDAELKAVRNIYGLISEVVAANDCD